MELQLLDHLQKLKQIVSIFNIHNEYIILFYWLPALIGFCFSDEVFLSFFCPSSALPPSASFFFAPASARAAAPASAPAAAPDASLSASAGS